MGAGGGQRFRVGVLPRGQDLNRWFILIVVSRIGFPVSVRSVLFGLVLGSIGLFTGATPSPVAANNTPAPILWLDASNPASYPGAGTTWTDLSATRRNATLVGNLTFDAVNKAIVFPGGVNGTAFVNLGSDLGAFNAGLTIEFEGEFGSTRSNWERIFDFAQGVGMRSVPFNSFWVGQYEGRNELAMEVWDNQIQRGYCHTATDGTGLGQVGVRTFYKWVITIANDANKTCRIFRNGVEMTTKSRIVYDPDVASAGSNANGSPFVLPPTVNRTTNFLGRSNFDADRDLEGSIRYIRIYNTTLTPQQVLSNATATVTFDNNGGTGSMPAQTSTTSTALTTNTLTRLNHTFDGWNTSATGQGTAYANGASFPFTANTTLFAQWDPITLTFDPNGGSGSMPNHSAASGNNVPGNTFNRSGHVFVGWNTASNGSGTAVGDAGSFSFSSDTTLFAQWALIPPIVFTPPSTTSTTVAPVTVPQPVRDTDGELPSFGPGDGRVTEGGTAVPIEVYVENQRTLVTRGSGFELRLRGECPVGCGIESAPDGRPTVVLDANGRAVVEGSGFVPGSLVHVWLFSEPQYLGSVEVGDDGRFAGSVTLSGIAPGSHTVQVNGSSAGGEERSASLGVVVRSSPSLPVTGSGGHDRLVIVALLIGLLGTAAWLRSRRLGVG